MNQPNNSMKEILLSCGVSRSLGSLTCLLLKPHHSILLNHFTALSIVVVMNTGEVEGLGGELVNRRIDGCSINYLCVFVYERTHPQTETERQKVLFSFKLNLS